MTGGTTLIEKREELKLELATGEHKTLGRAAADWVEQILRKFTRNRHVLPLWYKFVVIALILLLIEYSLALILKPHILTPKILAFRVIFEIVVFLMLFILETYVGHCFSFAGNHLIEAMESVADLTDFQCWLNSAFSRKKQFFFGLAFVVLFAAYGPITNSNLLSYFDSSSIFSLVVAETLVGAYFYFFFPGVSLAIRFGGRYQFRLYAADPSASEFIDHLSNTLSYGVYIAGAFVAIFTFMFSTYRLFSIPIIVLSIISGWVPVTAFFVANQYVMSRIIIRSKWQTLNNIQAKIELLQSQEELPSVDTLKHVRALIDYHNFIKTTRNSVLNLRAALNFLNSLLLPLVALLLGNIDKLLDLVTRVSQ